MRKIFITAHSMEIGGAERSLLGLHENIDYKKYQVDLFLLRHSGELITSVPKEVNLLPECLSYSTMGIPIREALKKRQFRVVLGRIHGWMRAKRRVKKLKLSRDNNIFNEYSHKYTMWTMPNMSDKVYDLAVSFMAPHYYVIGKVKAKKKVAWIHTDYSTFQVDWQSEAVMWGQYDRIISLSDKVTDSFLAVFPKLKEKVVVIENIMPMHYVEKLVNACSVEEEIPKFDGINLLSIGRFSYPKNFDNIPEICKLILKKEEKIRWYIIGFGGDEMLIRRQIESTGMQEHVFILGKKDNPYPYIKACDIYVQPSRYEGKSIAVREAQMLGKLTIITNYATAASQLRDGYDGVIVPRDNIGCANGIYEVIKNEEMRDYICQNMKKEDYVSAGEIQKFYELMND